MYRAGQNIEYAKSNFYFFFLDTFHFTKLSYTTFRNDFKMLANEKQLLEKVA